MSRDLTAVAKVVLESARGINLIDDSGVTIYRATTNLDNQMVDIYLDNLKDALSLNETESGITSWVGESDPDVDDNIKPNVTLNTTKDIQLTISMRKTPVKNGKEQDHKYISVINSNKIIVNKYALSIAIPLVIKAGSLVVDKEYEIKLDGIGEGLYKDTQKPDKKAPVLKLKLKADGSIDVSVTKGYELDKIGKEQNGALYAAVLTKIKTLASSSKPETPPEPVKPPTTPAEGSGSENNKPSTGGSSNSGSTNKPSTGGSGNSGSTNKPSTGGSSSSGSTNKPSTGGSSSSGSSPSFPPTPPTPPAVSYISSGTTLFSGSQGSGRISLSGVKSDFSNLRNGIQITFESGLFYTYVRTSQSWDPGVSDSSRKTGTAGSMGVSSAGKTISIPKSSLQSGGNIYTVSGNLSGITGSPSWKKTGDATISAGSGSISYSIPSIGMSTLDGLSGIIAVIYMYKPSKFGDLASESYIYQLRISRVTAY